MGETNVIFAKKGKGNAHQTTPMQMPYLQYPYVATVQYPTMPYQQAMPIKVPVKTPQVQVPQNHNQQRNQNQ